jgi:ABC-type sugar transport system substrate-binding protein
MAMSDRLAMGVMAAARAKGLAVPGDVSVTGFDDIAAAAHARPALTTVRQELRLKGYAAARLLLDAPIGAPGMVAPAATSSSEGGGVLRRTGDHPLASSGDAADEELGLPLELVVRRSTAGPPDRQGSAVRS